MAAGPTIRGVGEPDHFVVADDATPSDEDGGAKVQARVDVAPDRSGEAVECNRVQARGTRVRKSTACRLGRDGVNGRRRRGGHRGLTLVPHGTGRLATTS